MVKWLDKLANGAPICAMIRGMMENILSAKVINDIFERNAVTQYTRKLLFSDVLDLMAGVVLQVFPSVSGAYQNMQKLFPVKRRALFYKLEKMDLNVIRALIRETAAKFVEVSELLRKKLRIKPILRGYRLRILDGNHLAATDHRIKELRDIAAGPLPGKSLVVYDPDAHIIVDVFPCLDGHTSERVEVADVLGIMEAGDVWIADRHFCTSAVLFQTIANGAYFVIRQHATNVRWTTSGRRKSVGRTESGRVYEQRIEISNDMGECQIVRRVTLCLEQPTQDGDRELHVLTNLPSSVRTKKIAELYHKRWKIEGAFGEMATALKCEVSTLGYPPAALFAFAVGLLCYNILQILKLSLAVAHGPDQVNEISSFYMTDEIAKTRRGVDVFVSDRDWERGFGNLTPRQLARLLIAIAKRVDLAQFQKHKRGPKKPAPKRTRYRNKTHVSTARILAERSEK